MPTSERPWNGSFPALPTLSTGNSSPLALHTRDDNTVLRGLFDTRHLAGRPAADGIAFILNELPTDLRLIKLAADSAWKTAWTGKRDRRHGSLHDALLEPTADARVAYARAPLSTSPRSVYRLPGLTPERRPG